jgi:hypothetical protein
MGVNAQEASTGLAPLAGVSWGVAVSATGVLVGVKVKVGKGVLVIAISPVGVGLPALPASGAAQPAMRTPIAKITSKNFFIIFSFLA